MAKSKRSSAAKRPAAPPVKTGSSVKPDPKELNREISNSLFTDEERAGIFFAQHWKKLLAVALVAVVAVTVVFAIARHRETVRKETSARLAGANTVADLKAALAAADPKVPGVDAARFRLAKLYAEQKEFDKARQTLKTIADTSDDAASRGSAKLNIAYLLELDPKVNKEDAAKEFAVIADLAENDLALRAEAAYAAARLYIDLKRPDNAKLLMDKILLQLNDRQVSRGAAYWCNRLAELKVSIN